MIFRLRQFRKSLAFLAVILLTPLAQAEPDAEAILHAARVNPLNQNIALDARLRTGSTVWPFTLTVDGAIHYTFTDPDQELILELNDDGAVLKEKLGGKTATVRPARYDEILRDSGLTYEDVSLQFLYWKNPKIIGEDFIRSRKTWKIELQAPRGRSQYGAARLWIDQESGALLKMEGYNLQGRMTRRFEIVSAQKIDGMWMLKQMRVEILDPDTKKVTTRTYLEVLGRKG